MNIQALNIHTSLKRIFPLLILLNFSCQNAVKSQEKGEPKNAINPDQTTWHSKEFKHLNDVSPYSQYAMFMKKVLVLKNQNKVLPLLPSKGTLFVSSSDNAEYYYNRLQFFSNGKKMLLKEFIENYDPRSDKFSSIEQFVFSFHEEVPLHTEIVHCMDSLPYGASKIGIFFRSVDQAQDSLLLSKLDGIILGYENHFIAQEGIAQSLFGTDAFSIQKNVQTDSIQQEIGEYVPSNGRLGFTYPEAFGIPKDSLNIIDQLAVNGIVQGAYPGCQVLIAVKGKVIYNKSFGNHTYEKNSKRVNNHDLYDLASITKIAASTLLTMDLHSKNQINLNNTLGYYLDEVKGTSYENISLKSMMAHQAGFVAWIPFYRKTLLNNRLNEDIYSTKKSNQFSMHVADNIYMNKDYIDSMYQWIYTTKLKSKTYRYSDLCFYFMKKILEKKTGSSLDQYLENGIYKELGLQTMCYNPLRFTDPSRIAPTEDDKIYRNQLVHGYVHDQGAAMLGGVGGHAGLFSNAYDLAVLMQLFLNKGTYAGKEYLKPSTIEQFTKQQYSNNRRGAGFDRPKTEGGGTCDKSCSQKSYGHSGFTGTLAWADPANEVIVVFLSNRVYPDAQNWKIVKMNTRTDIQHEINRLLHKFN